MINSIIPTFSLSKLKQGQDQARFLKCLTEMGVFYLIDYEVPLSSQTLARDAVMDFFKHSTEQEQKSVIIDTPNIRRGYSKLGTESTALVTNSGEYSDYSMCYSMGMKDNLFPNDNFKNIWSEYFNQMYKAAQHTAREVLHTIGSDSEEDIDSLLNCDPVLRFRYYPEVPENRCAEKEPLRVAPHYDLSIVTLLYQTPCANGFVSLQCEIDNKYIDLPPIENSIIVFCGAVATIVSKGRIKSPKHRVLAPELAYRAGSSRTSSVFFLRPKPDFTFSIPLAKSYGLAIDLKGDSATFLNWISGNYEEMKIPTYY